ncbi:hypothetical protein BDP27DRAFT_1406067, partial [Rhodocollybia butyracea]
MIHKEGVLGLRRRRRQKLWWMGKGTWGVEHLSVNEERRRRLKMDVELSLSGVETTRPKIPLLVKPMKRLKLEYTEVLRLCFRDTLAVFCLLVSSTGNKETRNERSATLEDDKLVEYPSNSILEYGGPGDDLDSFIAPIRKEYLGFYKEWVPLVPDTPVMHAPSNTLWNRVNQCPPVEYYIGYWHIWEGGPLPAPSPPEAPDFLNKKNDTLTQLRVKNISKYPEMASSNSASASNTSTLVKDNLSTPAPLAIGRPKRDNYYPIPPPSCNPNSLHSAKTSSLDHLIKIWHPLLT